MLLCLQQPGSQICLHISVSGRAPLFLYHVSCHLHLHDPGLALLLLLLVVHVGHNLGLHEAGSLDWGTQWVDNCKPKHQQGTFCFCCSQFLIDIWFLVSSF